MTIDTDRKLIVFDTCHDKAALKKWADALDTYTKDSLCTILQKITTRFPDFFMRMSNESWMLKLPDIIKRAPQTKKAVLVETVAKILASKENRAVIVQSMSKEEILVWRYLMLNLYIAENKVAAIIGDAPITVVKTGYYSTSQTLHRDVCWFSNLTMGSWYRPVRYFFIPAFIRAAFAGVLGFNNIVEKEDTSEEQATPPNVSQFETETLALLPVVKNLWANGQLELGRFRIGQATINRAVKLTRIAPFIIGPDDKNARNLRASYLLNAYALYTDAVQKRGDKANPEPQDLIKKMMKWFESNTGALIGTLLPFIDKSTSKLYEGNTLWALWLNVTGLLTSRPAGTWFLKVEVLDNMYRIADINNTLRIISFRAIDDSMVCNLRTGESLNPSNIVQLVAIPALYSILGFFTALGLLEMEYDTADPDTPSPFQGLRRVRLTSLGAYALGLSKTYAYCPPPEAVYFELESDRLLIRAIGDSNPYEGMLTQFAVPVGGRRYAVTPESFLSDCHSKTDIKRKVKTFKQVVSKDPGSIWEEFFKRLETNCDAFDDTTGDYKIYEVSPIDHDLHELLATNPEIRQYVFRVEDYKILIPKDRETTVRNLLRKAGYIL